MPNVPKNLGPPQLGIPEQLVQEFPVELQPAIAKLLIAANQSFAASASKHAASGGAAGTVGIRMPEGTPADTPALQIDKGRIIIKNTGTPLRENGDDNKVLTLGDLKAWLTCERLSAITEPCLDIPDQNFGQAQTACQPPALKQLSLVPLVNINGPSVVLGGAYAYIAGTAIVGNLHILQVWNVDDTSNPTLTATFTSGVAASGPGVQAVRQGRYLYAMNLADAFSGNIVVWDIYDAAHCFVLATISVGESYDIYPNGKYLYIAQDNIVRIDASAPADIVNPGPNYTVIIADNLSAYRGLVAQDGFLYGANIGIGGSGSVDSYAIYDPTSPAQVGTLALGGTGTGPFAIAAEAGFVFTVDVLGNLYVIDVDNPLSMQLKATVALPSAGLATSRSIVLDGDNLIVSGPADATYLFDITTRTSPQLLATDASGVGRPSLEGRNLIGVT